MGEEHAVEAMRAGADDYVLKEDLARLVPAVERGLATPSIAARPAARPPPWPRARLGSAR
jgi:hypothetical protein